MSSLVCLPSKTVPVDISIEADCGHSLSLIIPHVRSADRPQWFSEIAEWKRRYPWYYTPQLSPDSPLKPQSVIQELNKQVDSYKERVIITTGVGQHQMWAAQWYRWRYPRSFVTSGGLGTMGYGLPSAIGAKVARPDMMVIDIDGDASLSMTAMELMTASEFNVKVKVLVLNNNFQGMVKVGYQRNSTRTCHTGQCRWQMSTASYRLSHFACALALPLLCVAVCRSLGWLSAMAGSVLQQALQQHRHEESGLGEVCQLDECERHQSDAHR